MGAPGHVIAETAEKRGCCNSREVGEATSVVLDDRLFDAKGRAEDNSQGSSLSSCLQEVGPCCRGR